MLSLLFPQQLIAKRLLHSSAVRLARRRGGPDTSEDDTPENWFDLDEVPEFEDLDSSAAGHRKITQERQILKYLRLIDGQMQQLRGTGYLRFSFGIDIELSYAAFRQEYRPPTEKEPLLIRTLSYGNESHPVDRKRTIVAPVAKLPLSTQAAVHKFILLAGARWTALPPKDSGFGSATHEVHQGFIKISCERFEKPGMNLKWASDVLDKLVLEANVSPCH
jgi:small subunit ribosomal protein S35